MLLSDGLEPRCRPPRAGKSRTLAQGLGGRDNALNFVRLVLAVLVIVSHSVPIGGYADGLGAASGTITGFGEWAVRAFFAISGYLIVGSRLRTTLSGYLWRRFLRILPGYWVMLFVVAFGFAPVSTLLEPGAVFSARDALDYVVRSLFLYRPAYEIQGTLVSVPFHAWNGSIWTLFYEFLAYVTVAILFAPRWVRERGAVISPALLLVAVIALPAMEGPLEVTTNLYLHAVRLGAYFLGGVTLYFWRDRITVSKPALLASIAVSLLLMYGIPEVGIYVAQLPLAATVLMLGAQLPIGLGSKNDLSYGMYIYAFPVQQTVTLLLDGAIGFVAHVVIATALTVPVAALSWLLVERPALRLKRLVR